MANCRQASFVAISSKDALHLGDKKRKRGHGHGEACNNGSTVPRHGVRKRVLGGSKKDVTDNSGQHAPIYSTKHSKNASTANDQPGTLIVQPALGQVVQQETRDAQLGYHDTVRMNALLTVLLKGIAFALVTIFCPPSSSAHSKGCTDTIAEVYPDHTQVEGWVWEQVCKHDIADLAKKEGNTDENCSKKGTGPQAANYKLRNDFVRSILLSTSARPYLAYDGLRIRCATFVEEVNISQIHFPHDLWLSNSYFAEGIDAYDYRTENSLSLSKSRFFGQFTGGRMSIAGGLFMRGALFDKGIFLDHSMIHGGLHLNNSTIRGFSGRNISVNGTFGANFASFCDEIVLHDAAIVGSLVANDIRICGTLDAERISITGALSVQNSHLGEAVNLRNASIGSSMLLSGSSLIGGLFGNGLKSGGDLSFHGALISGGGLDLSSARIDGSVDFATSRFQAPIDLTLAVIEGSLVLADHSGTCPFWGEASGIVLTGGRVAGLKDHICSWDGLNGRIDLTGFTYQHFVPIAEIDSRPTIVRNITPRGVYERESEQGTPTTMAGRSVEWMQIWLNKQAEFSPKSYTYLASRLRQYGFDDKADRLMIAMNHGRLENATEWWSQAWLWLSGVTIGYGYRNERPLQLILVLAVIGALVGHGRLRFPGAAPPVVQEFVRSWWYSVDRLIPLLELDVKHNAVPLNGWIRLYFFLHRILGFVLLSYYIGGITGLADQ